MKTLVLLSLLALGVPLTACAGSGDGTEAAPFQSGGTSSAAAGGLPGSSGAPGSGGSSVAAGGFPGAGGSVNSGGGGMANAGGTSTGGVGGAAGSTPGGTGGEGTAGSAGSGGASGDAGSGDGGSPPMGCTGKPGAISGKSNQMLSAGGLTRTFVYYAPPNLDPNTPTPLVIVPHGWTMSGQAMYDITGYHTLADQEGFVVAYPDGGPGAGPWNVGAGICGAGAFVNGANDDQAFIQGMIDFVDQDRCLDKDHVFVSGFSMGGYFSNETGCQRSDIAAIGPHSGGSHPLASCPGSIKPVIVFHFRGDALISYDCGSEAATRWAERNGCSAAAPEMRSVQGGTCAYYKDCDAQVAFCSFDIPAGATTLIAGHGWAGGAPNSFSVPGTASATDLGWAFFKEFAW